MTAPAYVLGKFEEAKGRYVCWVNEDEPFGPEWKPFHDPVDKAIIMGLHDKYPKANVYASIPEDLGRERVFGAYVDGVVAEMAARRRL